MSALAKTFDGQKYIAVFLADGSSLINQRRRDDLHAMWTFIADSVGETAAIVIPPSGGEDEQNNRLRGRYKKFYDLQIAQQLPCLLVVDEGFGDFEPENSNWAIVALRPMFDRNGNLSPNKSEEFTRKFVSAVKSERTIFEQLYEMTIDENRKNLLSSLELKPGFFGFSIDLKGFLRLRLPKMKS